MKKHWKKNIRTRKTYYYYIWQEGPQIHEKKIVSVGLFSTFRHILLERKSLSDK